MVYTPTGDTFVIDISGLHRNKVKARWMNPLTGQYIAVDSASQDGPKSRRQFSPPRGKDHSDWVLVLEASSK